MKPYTYNYWRYNQEWQIMLLVMLIAIIWHLCIMLNGNIFEKDD